MKRRTPNLRSVGLPLPWGRWLVAISDFAFQLH